MPRSSFIIGQKHVVVFPQKTSELHQLADQRLPESEDALYFIADFFHEFVYSLLKDFGHLQHSVAKSHNLTSRHDTTPLYCFEPVAS